MKRTKQIGIALIVILLTGGISFFSGINKEDSNAEIVAVNSTEYLGYTMGNIVYTEEADNKDNADNMNSTNNENITDNMENINNTDNSDSDTKNSDSEETLDTENTDSNTNNNDELILASGDLGVNKRTITGGLETTTGETESLDANGSNTNNSNVDDTINTTNTTNATNSTNTTTYVSDILEESSGKYDYCPSVIKSGNTLNIWFCSNKNANKVVDVIDYIKVNTSDNGYQLVERTTVLYPSSSGWDSQNVCDPSVIEGSFTYNGKTYKYLMAYLGCKTTDCSNNEVGLAVSNSMDSGWVKCDSINPIVGSGCDSSDSRWQWGTGQPSLVSLGSGKVLLFYTYGTATKTCEKCELWDLSDIDSGILIDSVVISNSGLLQTNGSSDYISNADFSYDGNTLYMVCDRHPFKSGVLSVASTSRISKAVVGDLSESLSALSSVTWSDLEYISEYDRNHNAGFIRNSTGSLWNGVVYTSASIKSSFLSSLLTYRLREYSSDYSNY